MGKGKSRHNPNKPQNQLHCPYDDGTKWKECGYPWANRCTGDRHHCVKLRYHYLASLSPKEREACNL